MNRWPLSVAALGVSALAWLGGRLFEMPSLPRRITFKALETLWFDGLFRGAVFASLAWLALIVFALILRRSKA